MASNDSAHCSSAKALAVEISPDQNTVGYGRNKRREYVQLNTNFGPFTLELYSDSVPKTCAHFMRHCQNGFFNGTTFHRSIKNSMVRIRFDGILTCRNSCEFLYSNLCNSFNGVTRLKLITAMKLKTKFHQNYHTLDVAFCRWQNRH